MVNVNTIKALVRLGIDEVNAEKISKAGYSIKRLKTTSKMKLKEILPEPDATEAFDNLKVIRKKRKSNKEKETPIQKEKKKLKNKIRTTFQSMGFEYLQTRKKHVIFGKGHGSEFDSIFLYENLIIICEDTFDQSIRDHIKGKHAFYDQVKKNRNEFIHWIKTEFPKSVNKFKNYREPTYRIYFFYVHKPIVDIETKEEYGYIHFIDERTLGYFYKISNCIKNTSINELFKYLDLDLHDIGKPSSTAQDNKIETAVILPEESSGFDQGYKIVSFLISADDLMNCSYVLRKENWEDKFELYQRLLSPTRISDIRKFIATGERTFLNNVIVSLPDTVTFYREEKTKRDITKRIEVKHNDLTKIENLIMSIPKRINTICIIDGQHRIFAHYKTDSKKDPNEKSIKRIREDNHLLATGILFPDKTRLDVRIKFESEIFYEINSNQKKPKTALLQDIKSLHDPYSSVGISKKILRKLNERSPFLGKLQIYPSDTKVIHTASIVQWGLEDLVEIDEEKPTLFKFWTNKDKSVLTELTDINKIAEVFENYLDFCTDRISQYFKAVKYHFKNEWVISKESALLRATAITGLLIGYQKSLFIYQNANGYEFYKDKLSNLDIDFNPKEFLFISSHWARFGDYIKEQCWK